MTALTDAAKRLDVGFALSEPHREGCWGAEAGGFVCYSGTENRDRNGRKMGGRGQEWHRFKCNDPSCDAVALVRWDVLAGFVNAEVPVV